MITVGMYSFAEICYISIDACIHIYVGIIVNYKIDIALYAKSLDIYIRITKIVRPLGSAESLILPRRYWRLLGLIVVLVAKLLKVKNVKRLGK